MSGGCYTKRRKEKENALEYAKNKFFLFIWTSYCSLLQGLPKASNLLLP